MKIVLYMWIVNHALQILFGLIVFTKIKYKDNEKINFNYFIKSGYCGNLKLCLNGNEREPSYSFYSKKSCSFKNKINKCKSNWAHRSKFHSCYFDVNEKDRKSIL